MSRYIHDKELDEYYVPEHLQCEKCSNEAVIDGLCQDCYELIVLNNKIYGGTNGSIKLLKQNGTGTWIEIEPQQEKS